MSVYGEAGIKEGPEGGTATCQPGLSGYACPGSGSTTGGSSSPGVTSPAPTPEDPWSKFADLLAGFGGTGISLPASEPQSITYVPTTGRSPWALLLLLGAAAGGIWWYTQRKKGGAQ